jgi:CHAT domain-containing protein/Flp pilus assembly protein TadD
MNTFLVVLYLAISFIGFSQDIEHSTIEAEKLYLQAHYDSATVLYQQIIDNTTNVSIAYHARKGLIKSLTKSSNYKEAQKTVNESLSQFKKELERAELLNLKTLIEFRQGNYQQALKLCDSILSIIKAQEGSELLRAKVLNQMSRNELWLSHTPKADSLNGIALSWYNKAQEEDPLTRAKIANIAGIINYFDGAFEAAIVHFSIAKDAKLKILNENHPEIAGLYDNIGVMYNHLRQFDKALEFFTHSLSVKKQFLSPTHSKLAITYTNIGIAHENKGNLKRAGEAQLLALEIRKKLGETHPKTLDIYEHLGSLSKQRGDYKEAEYYFNRVLKGRIDNYGKYHSHVAYIYLELGDLEQIQNNNSKAMAYFEIALEIGKKVYSDNNYDLARIYVAMGRNLLALRQNKTARKYFVLGLEANIPNINLDVRNPEKSDFEIYLRFDELLDAMIGLVATFSMGTEQDLVLANKYINIGQDLLKKVQKNITKEKDRVSLADANKALNQEAIFINFQLYKKNNQRSQIKNIFALSEASKNLSLLATLSDTKSKEISGIPDSLLKKEKQYRISSEKIRSELIHLNRSADSIRWFELKKQSFQISNKHDKFISQLEIDYPKYFTLKYGEKILSLDELQDKLEPNCALIEYFTSDDNKIYATIILKNEVYILDWAMKDQNEVAIKFIQSIQSQNEQFEPLSKQLFKEIMAPPLAKIGNKTEKLIIISDGILSYIPFELLQGKNDNKYLMDSYVISYGLSASLYFRNESKTKKLGSFLGYSPDFEELPSRVTSSLSDIRSSLASQANLINLPGAKREIEEASQIMKGKIRIGNLATETSFKNESIYYNIVHLATHGIIENQNPDYSKLALSTDEENDGFLHSYEIRNLNLSANLAVLSACESGIGKLANGEGVMSLSRAFAYAGVPATVVSLWPASDKSTPELMKYFYQNLADGQAKDVALNNARKEYLKHAKGKARHPFYWGGFVLIGDNSPIIEKKNIWRWLLYMFVGMAVMVAIFQLREKRGRLPRKEIHYGDPKNSTNS